MTQQTDLDHITQAVEQYLAGAGRHNPSALRALAREPLRLAARLELLRRTTTLVVALDDDCLRAVALGTIDLAAKAREVAFRLEEADQLDAPRHMHAEIEAAVADIARQHLGLATLSAKDKACPKFAKLSVAALAAALKKAYVAGWHGAA